MQSIFLKRRWIFIVLTAILRMILGLTEAGAVPQPIAVAFSSEVDEVPNSSQRFAEWQEEPALLTLPLQQRVLAVRFPFSFPFLLENTVLPSCLTFLFPCQCSGKTGVNGVLFVKSLEVLLWTSLIEICAFLMKITCSTVFLERKTESHIYF